MTLFWTEFKGTSEKQKAQDSVCADLSLLGVISQDTLDRVRWGKATGKENAAEPGNMTIKQQR